MAVSRMVLGIDLGTSNTSAAWMDAHARLNVATVQGSESIMPSVAWMSPDGTLVVGHEARHKLMEEPKNAVFGLKRYLGRLYKSEFVTRHLDRVPFKLVEDVDGTCAVELRGRVVPLTEIAAAMLRKMAALAAATAGQEFRDCVLTVPAHYGYRQRQAMRSAAELASLRIKALVNEPTAAALAYVKQKDAGARVLVFDLGGGTFDATLISISGHVVRVLANGGDAFLGGADFDERIATHFAERFEQENGVTIQQDRNLMRRLTFASEMAKIVLSQEEKAPLRVLFATTRNNRPVDLDYVLDRPTMDAIIAPLIERACGACDQLLERVRLKASDVDEILLVGGQTRTPALRKRLLGLYKHDASRMLNPELSVCAGAAMLGRALSLPAGAGLSDAVSIPIWMAGPGAAPVVAIPANAPVPFKTRVELALPPPGAGTSLLFYEALEAASLDREIVGSVKLDAAQVASGGRPLALEASINERFALEVSLVKSSGELQPLALEAPPNKSRP